MSILGMIPARGGSKRLRAKNARKLNGKPLVAHTIEAALESDVFDEVIVSTDDGEIADIATEYGATVPFTRPTEYATDEAQVKDVARHAIEYYADKGREFDRVSSLLPTTPLRTAEDIRAANQKFEATDCNYLIAVTDYRYTPVRAFVSDGDEYIKPYWLENSSFDDREDIFARSQDHPDFLVDCGSIYTVRTEAFLDADTFHGEKCVGYYLPPERAIDIDDRFDLKVAELLLQDELETREGGYDLLGGRH